MISLIALAESKVRSKEQEAQWGVGVIRKYERKARDQRGKQEIRERGKGGGIIRLESPMKTTKLAQCALT